MFIVCFYNGVLHHDSSIFSLFFITIVKKNNLIQSFCTQCFKAKSKTASSTKHINPSSHWKTRWEGIFFSMFNHQRDHRSLLVRSLTVGFPLVSPLLRLGEAYPPLLSFIEPMYLSSFWGLSAALIPATALHVPGTQPVIESGVCYFFIFSVLFLTVIRDALKQLFAAVKKTKMVIWSCHYFTQRLLCRDTQARIGSSTHARCDWTQWASVQWTCDWSNVPRKFWTHLICAMGFTCASTRAASSRCLQWGSHSLIIPHSLKQIFLL